MNVNSGTHTRLETEKSCCLWKESSQLGSNLKISAVVITEALAAIALLGGVLILAAKLGYPLGEINSIAAWIDTQWLYVGLGVTVSIAVVNTVAIFALHRILVNKNYQENFREIESSEEQAPAFESPAQPNEYPHDQGIERLQKHKELVDDQKYEISELLDKEYIHDKIEEDLYVVIVKNGDNADYHFFDNETDKELFIELNPYTYGIHRHNTDLITFICSAKAMMENNPNANQRYYRVFRYPDSKKAVLFTCSKRAELCRSQYLPIDEVENEIAKLKDYTRIDESQWLTWPLTEEEKHYLKEVAFKYKIDFITKFLADKPDSYCVYERGPYSVLIIKNQNEFQYEFYKKGDPKINEMISGSLKGYKPLILD